MSAILERTTFSTSRLLEFCTRKELVAQTGHQPDVWPVMVLKELLDNAIDAAEEAGIPPTIEVIVDDAGITVRDNGPGIARRARSRAFSTSTSGCRRARHTSARPAAPRATP